jgi:DNA repair and recombination RAD54-like protein
MLKRIPSHKSTSGDPQVVTLTGGGFSMPTFKAFKPPSLANSRSTRTAAADVDKSGAGRKRKRVNYKEDGQADAAEDGDANGDGSDGEGGKKKGKTYSMGNKEYGIDGVLGDMGKWCNRKFPVFEVKPKEVIFTKK